MKRHAVTILAVGAMLLSSGAMAEEAEPRPVLELAKEALVAGKPNEALAFVEPLIVKAEASEAKDPDAMCPGKAVAILGAFLAQQDPRIVITAGDDWCEAMLLKGYALVELKRFDPAVAVLEKLVSHDRTNPNYLAEYAFALQSAGQLEKSFKVYEKVEDAAGKLNDKAARRRWRAVALRGMGYIYSDRRQWDEAAKAYKQSLKLEPGNKIALGELDYIERNRTVSTAP